MQRRVFITLLGGAAAAWPLDVRAQRVRRIGVLMAEAENDGQSQARRKALEQGLAKLGWMLGQNLQIDYRWAAGDVERTRIGAAELVHLAPDVILVAASFPLRMLQQATSTIPIVFVGITEPVAQGFIASLAHPGGNLTGFANMEPTFAAKWMELLKEVAPRIARVAVIYNPDTTANAAGFVQSLQAAAQKFTVQPVTTEVRQVADIEAATTMLASNSGSGIIVLPDPFTVTNRKPLIAAAAHHQLPAVYPFRFFASDGGLISYSVDIPEQFRLAAGYVDRILKGERPTNLPVQQPAKFELVINLKTAQALDLSIPTTLIATADEVIE